MIKEDYVSFEIAKLLKEKGFDEGCFQYYVICLKWDGVPYQDYVIEFRRLYPEDEPLINSKGLKCFSEERNKHSVFSAPTLQMVMKWLREVHNIHIEILANGFQSETYTYKAVIQNRNIWYDYAEIYEYKVINPYDTYEEACEAAIKYCLENLI